MLVLAWSGLGKGAAIGRLVEQLGCAQRVVWLGRTGLTLLLAALDVLALPYRFPIGQNAFPNVLLEAHGIGVPLVTTRIPVVDEGCVDTETALLVRRDEPETLAGAVEQLLADESMRNHMVSCQQRRYADQFSANVLARRYEDLYSEVLAERTPVAQRCGLSLA